MALAGKGWGDRAETSGILLNSKLQDKFIVFLSSSIVPFMGITCPLEDNNITIRGTSFVRRWEGALVLRQSAHAEKN